jgi:UDP-hydrolysing UDP-N-acetyl-D-glucosamine 2-epimerase
MKILVYLGGRANYSSIKSVMELMRKDDFFELVTVAGCSAVLEKFGNVADLIEGDGFYVNERVYHLIEGDSTSVMAKTAALGMLEASSILARYNPDFVIIVGDRYEMMSFALPAAYMNIRVIHTMGGEVTGTIDESIRHALTKFSHIHFVATEKSRERVIKMGEDDRFVINSGCPRLDLVKNELMNDSRSVLTEYFKIKKGIGSEIDFNKPFVLVSHHPVTTEYAANRRYMDNILTALKDFGMQALILWPNSDAGGNQIAKAIRTFRENNSGLNFAFHKNLPNPIYIHLMNMCYGLVGNSSSGIREGAFIGTRVINIGSRQNTRECGSNVVHVQNDYEEILNALNSLKHQQKTSDNIYGSGNAANEIIEFLKNMNEFPSIQKTIRY